MLGNLKCMEDMFTNKEIALIKVYWNYLEIRVLRPNTEMK